MYRVGKKRDYRRKNRTKIQEFFDPGLQIFQKTPVTVLEELFPKRAVYSWAVARNYGCADLFRCRVTVPNCTGESISFSKQIAKHQAALETLINLQKYSGNRDLENFIRSYVCGGSSIFCLKSIFPGQENVNFAYEGTERSRSRTRGRNRSRTRPPSRCIPQVGNEGQKRSRSCSRTRGRSSFCGSDISLAGPPTDEQSQRRSRSCSRARGRSPFHGSDKFGGGCQMACAPMGETNAVKCLEEECKLSGIPAPEYSPHFQGRTGEWVVVAKLGPFTSKGFGMTRELAKQAAAAALIDSFFMEN
ncbi:uncharacterized protein [Rhodnius prolixus]|uniref:uncharacterized protein n=1 Tax=Rhodnius prolixus TaxID=13249 RepID=UPI003D18E35D